MPTLQTEFAVLCGLYRLCSHLQRAFHLTYFRPLSQHITCLRGAKSVLLSGKPLLTCCKSLFVQMSPSQLLETPTKFQPDFKICIRLAHYSYSFYYSEDQLSRDHTIHTKRQHCSKQIMIISSLSITCILTENTCKIQQIPNKSAVLF